MAAAVIALGATVINYLFFRSQIDPHVIVYAMPDERRPSIILLVIENIGKGLAKDVTFTSSRPIPTRAFGFEDAPMPEPMRDGPLITGIPALGPGAKRVITWGQFGGLKKGIGNSVIEITARFRSDKVGPFDQINHEVVCPVDIKSFEGTDASDTAYEKKIAEELHKISGILDQAASGFRALKIEVKKPQPLRGVKLRSKTVDRADIDGDSTAG